MALPYVGGKQPNSDGIGRSQPLENLIGNYMITDFQRTRLMEKIHEHITDYRHNPMSSTFMFKWSKKWWRVDLNITDITPVQDDDVTERVEKEAETNTDDLSMHFP